MSGIDVDLERLPGVDPAWSRFVEAAGARWHVLDNAAHLAGAARGTVLAVHGNPTWSYLWRGLLRPLAGAGWRVSSRLRSGRRPGRSHPKLPLIDARGR